MHAGEKNVECNDKKSLHRDPHHVITHASRTRGKLVRNLCFLGEKPIPNSQCKYYVLYSTVILKNVIIRVGRTSVKP